MRYFEFMWIGNKRNVNLGIKLKLVDVLERNELDARISGDTGYSVEKLLDLFIMVEWEHGR